MRGMFRAFFMTLGAYDLVLIYEAPDDAVSARFSVAAGVPGQRPDHDHEGLSRSGLSRGHRLARLAAYWTPDKSEAALVRALANASANGHAVLYSRRASL
jgi:hypothetical protein